MTTLLRRAWVSAAIALVTFLLGTAAAAGPSHDLSTYVLFGDHGIRARGFRIDHGDVGVNQGSLTAHDAIDAPDSTLAADVVSVGGRSQCAELFFTTAVDHAAPSCGPGTSYVGPLVADLPAACGVPDEFPDCSEGSAVDVAAGDERTLAPGVYGDVDVGGAASRHGRLVLTGGRYVFCSLRTHRGAVLEADSAAQVFVAGDVQIGPKSSLGPAEDTRDVHAGLALRHLTQRPGRRACLRARRNAARDRWRHTDRSIRRRAGRHRKDHARGCRNRAEHDNDQPAVLDHEHHVVHDHQHIRRTHHLQHDQQHVHHLDLGALDHDLEHVDEQQHRPDDVHLQHQLHQLDRAAHHDHGAAEHDNDNNAVVDDQQRCPHDHHLEHDHQLDRAAHHDHGAAEHDDDNNELVDDQQRRPDDDHLQHVH